MRVLLASLLLALLLAPTVKAAEQTPGFMHPEVLKAAIRIELTEEQQPLFRAAVGEFVDGRMKAFNRLIRSNNQTGIPRKMKRKTRSLLKNMDAQMATFLTEAQMPAYQVYRETLQAHLL